MKLSSMETGDKGTIRKVRGIGAFRKRIMEMGFVSGKEVEVVKNAPLQDPIEYKILGYNVTLRRSEAELINIFNKDHKNNHKVNHFIGSTSDSGPKNSEYEKCHIINIALIGNPNSGKTTLFNRISGARERVGNYSGVTVDSKTTEIKYRDYIFRITDLPGTYSMTTYSPEERYVRKYLIDKVPDLVVNVVDASNLERNLYLTTQLIDMDIKVVVALNMFDELTNKQDRFDHQMLGKMLGIPFIPTISSKGTGINKLSDEIIDVYEDKNPILRHIHINYGNCIEDSIKQIRSELSLTKDLYILSKISPRYIALKLLENDSDMIKMIKNSSRFSSIMKKVKKQHDKIESEFEEPADTIITDAKYGFISGALRETFKLGPIKTFDKTKAIDSFATHKFWGIPIFFLLMWIMFKATFSLGQFPMEWLEFLVGKLSEVISFNMAEGMLKDLLIDGVIGGVGGVIVFLPNILILFLFISFFEDSGYMSRAVFIIDKLMHKVGLHGRSFIPLIMGFGCSVPAIMATRTINSKKNRFVTILIIPFMSCGAKLPVYILMIGAFFPSNQGTILFSMYMIGIIVAILSAILLRNTLFKGDDTPFVMELPPYRRPTTKSIIIHMWDKTSQYLKKMGGIILAASIVIWALSYFPRDISTETISDNNLTTSYENTMLGNSYIGQFGQFVSPIFEPIGFDWKSNVAIISGFAGKELVVSTMGVLYNENEGNNLKEKIKNSSTFTTKNENSGLKAFVFMIFILLYIPCIATVIAIKNETKSWKWAAFSVFFTTSIAWIVSYLVFNIGKLLL
ncbi:MAG: ferrous iron transport protein B [Candidatus Delongbacteria bacterium]|nr:ferrous iron transport protein B [Candidatus Delongbacteria bacterium]